MTAHLEKADPAVYNIIEQEKKRQKHFINLIPSENFTSQAVLDALGSVMQSKEQCALEELQDGWLTEHRRQVF